MWSPRTTADAICRRWRVPSGALSWRPATGTTTPPNNVRMGGRVCKFNPYSLQAPPFGGAAVSATPTTSAPGRSVRSIASFIFAFSPRFQSFCALADSQVVPPPRQQQLPPAPSPAIVHPQPQTVDILPSGAEESEWRLGSMSVSICTCCPLSFSFVRTFVFFLFSLPFFVKFPFPSPIIILFHFQLPNFCLPFPLRPLMTPKGIRAK